jgi:hypothetical protein
MFGFGTSALATLLVIFGSPVVMCALMYVLVRLEPPVRQPMWLVDATTVDDADGVPADAESAA